MRLNGRNVSPPTFLTRSLDIPVILGGLFRSFLLLPALDRGGGKVECRSGWNRTGIDPFTVLCFQAFWPVSSYLQLIGQCLHFECPWRLEVLARVLAP